MNAASVSTKGAALQHAGAPRRRLDTSSPLVWLVIAVLFLALPYIFTKASSLSLMAQMGVMIVLALSYNMLLGQTGMLSFGHAVYSGLGAYFAIHALNRIGEGTLLFPVTLLPLIGGVFGALFGILFGWVSTKRSGVTFAMISLGIGELVHTVAMMFTGFFGGEGGIFTDRVAGEPLFGITYGPAIQVYYLVAAWTFIAMLAMFALTRTPLGRIANAVRDNPERAEFVGYNPQRVRFLMLTLSAFFAGVAGALMVMIFEIVNAENVGAIRSGSMLLATFIGGAGFFFGPVVGALLFVFFSIALAELTYAWQLYLGVFFVLLVMFAPGGLAGIGAGLLAVRRAGQARLVAAPLLAVLATGFILLCGIVALIEMTYAVSWSQVASAQFSLLGVPFDARSGGSWALGMAWTLVGAALFTYAWRGFRRRWDLALARIAEAVQAGGGA
ncbi:branched-chain amino acid ABC transporter permease [Verticiella sediminum]|uniref:Branched-chain amino acid ABC transporter permease n=1 Tax=Verticiella sediminum TaxID=1247510 RepID=A0A556AM06_9BURK|nr:branched-chain amino acid ABC transporter permease [Verticiella sediminum]TSH93907.1 branched-chain amino acid ABC transporter permease [Verticiella sediminum]